MGRAIENLIRLARDGDGDGRIHDGTPQEKPAPPKLTLKKVPTTGKQPRWEYGGFQIQKKQDIYASRANAFVYELLGRDGKGYLGEKNSLKEAREFIESLVKGGRSPDNL